VVEVNLQALWGRRKQVFYGWWIVAVSVVIDAMKHGTFNRGFTLYVTPLRKELGVGVAAISLADMMGRGVAGLLGPFAGYAVDHVGARAMLIFGGVASGVGFILLTLTKSYWYFLLIFVGLLSLGFRSGYNNATVPALNQWFRRRRSLAMSTASTGTGLGGFLVTPLMGLLVLTVGWRTAAMVSGIGIIAIVVPLALLVRRTPESMGLLPDGDTYPDADIAGQVEPRSSGAIAPESTDDPSVVTSRRRMIRDPDFTAKEALSTISFWLVVLAVGLRNTVHSGMSFLLAPVMIWFLDGATKGDDSGLSSAAMAALFIGGLSLSSMVLNPVVGWMGDKWSKEKISSIAMATGVLSLLSILNHSGQLWQMGVFVVLLAFSESANPLAWSLMGEYFGRKSYATLRGWQHLPDQLMSMSTPVWMGWIFDHSESGYFWALIPLAGIYALAAACYLIIPRPKLPSRLRRR
jgi:MFS family permease